MICPFCRTVNRDENVTCYKCEKDLSMLRLIVNKAKSHFNTALEFAERDRTEEAVAELQNAIDLDRSHVNSHVVLGTLYAKLGQLDRAEQCWREALAIDPRFEKAHDYLEKLQRGRKSLPIVRRQRLLMTVMLVILAALAAWSAFLSAPNPSQVRLTKAWARYNEGDYSDALDLLQTFSSAPSDNLIANQAQILRDLIRKHMAFLLASAKTYLDQNRIDEARKQVKTLTDLNPPRSILEGAGLLQAEIDRTGQALLLASAEENFAKLDLLASYRQTMELLSQNPSAQTEEKAAMLKERIALAAQAGLSAALEMLSEGKAAEETVRKQLDACREISADPAHDEFLVQSEKTLNLIVRTQKIDRAIQLFRQGKIDQFGLLERMTALSKEYPDYEKLRDTIAKFHVPLRDALTKRLKSELEADRLDDAESAIGALERLYGIVEPDKAESALSPLRAQLRTRRAESAVEEVKSALDSGDPEKTAALAKKSLEIPGIDATTRALLQTLLEKANVRLADELWKWMAELEQTGRYTSDRISLSEAKKTIESYPLVDKYVSRKTYPSADETLLFYLGMAYRKIGQTAEAAQTFDTLKQRFPQSKFLKWVKRYEPAVESSVKNSSTTPKPKSSKSRED